DRVLTMEQRTQAITRLKRVQTAQRLHYACLDEAEPQIRSVEVSQKGRDGARITQHAQRLGDGPTDTGIRISERGDQHVERTSITERAERLDRGYAHSSVGVLSRNAQQRLNSTSVPKPCKRRRCRLLEPAPGETGSKALQQCAEWCDGAPLTNL